VLVQILIVVEEADINYCLSVTIIHNKESDIICVNFSRYSCDIKIFEGENIHFLWPFECSYFFFCNFKRVASTPMGNGIYINYTNNEMHEVNSLELG
jgi:hypothetical protein